MVRDLYFCSKRKEIEERREAGKEATKRVGDKPIAAPVILVVAVVRVIVAQAAPTNILA